MKILKAIMAGAMLIVTSVGAMASTDAAAAAAAIVAEGSKTVATTSTGVPTMTIVLFGAAALAVWYYNRDE